MTTNEAERARTKYMSAPVGDVMSQSEATNALFVLVMDLQARLAMLEQQAATHTSAQALDSED